MVGTASADEYNIGYFDDGSTTGIYACRIVAGANNDVRVQIGTETDSDSDLDASQTFTLTSNADTLRIFSSAVDGSGLACDIANGDVLTAFTYGSNTLTINGGNGNDLMRGGEGFVTLNGDAGADHLKLLVDGVADGKAGNDVVVSDGATGEDLLGDADNDCVERIVETGAGNSMNGGSTGATNVDTIDLDTTDGTPTPKSAFEVENSSHSCGYAGP
jgi:hypothetical protein